MKHVTTICIGMVFFTLSVSAQLAEKAEDISPLLIGETVPDAVLKSTDSSDQSFLSILSDKPTVVLFYRGGWCPYCNAHLSDIRDAESEILELGYQIIAISPDSPENLKASDEKNELNYQLYSDANGKLTKAMGIAFKVEERRMKRLFDKSGGLNDGFLPVPSVFITDTNGQIVFEYINPNYKTRMSSKLLVAVLKNLD
jgi:peroxiredoxin